MVIVEVVIVWKDHVVLRQGNRTLVVVIDAVEVCRNAVVM